MKLEIVALVYFIIGTFFGCWISYSVIGNKIHSLEDRLTRKDNLIERLETRQEYATQLFATYEEIVKMQNELLGR